MTMPLSADSLPPKITQYAWLLIPAVLAGLLLPLTAILSGMQDGDGFITAMMSTGELTWYFWGQDRFLNLIPALSSWITAIDLNLRAQIFLRAMLAYAAPFGVLIFFTRSPRLLALAIAVTNLVLVLALHPYALFNLYVHHNPFGTSLVLFGIAYLSYSAGGPWRLALALLLCVLAYAVNLALLLLALPLLTMLLILRRGERAGFAGFFACNLVAIALAFVHSQMFGESNTKFDGTVSGDAIFAALKVISLYLSPAVLLTVLLLTVACLWRTRLSRIGLAALALSALVMAAALSNSVWVQGNLYNIRYFLTTLLVLCGAAGLIIASRLMEFVHGTKVLATLLIVAGVATLAGLHGFNRDYAELIDLQWRVAAKEVAAEAVKADTRLVIGEFWEVWPIVYETQRRRGAIRDRMPTVFGASFRGHGINEKVLASTVGKGPQTALCMFNTVEECIFQLRGSIRIPHTTTKIDVLAQEPIVIGKRQWLRLRLRFEKA